MAPLARFFTVQRTRLTSTSFARYTPQPLRARYATSSYGNEQSGHEQGTHENNPKSHLEHPGPEAPASKDSGSSSSSGGSSTTSGTSSGGKTRIAEDSSASEGQSEEVKKHNEDMAKRPNQSDNKAGQSGGSEDKNFWKGDVGKMNESKSDDSK